MKVEPASAKVVVLKDLPVNFANVDQRATYNYSPPCLLRAIA